MYHNKIGFSSFYLAEYAYVLTCLPILLTGESSSIDTWHYSCSYQTNMLVNTQNKAAGAANSIRKYI